MKQLTKVRLFGSIAALLVIFLDQLTKYFAIVYLKEIREVPFIPGFLDFRWVTNDGAAWGQFAGNKWILIGLTSVLIVALLYGSFTKHIQDPPLIFLFLLFAGGGVGNLIDRIRFGEVVDFLHFQFIEFPVFNLADAVISCSAVAALIYVAFFQTAAEQKRRVALEGEKTELVENALDECLQSAEEDAQ